MAQTLQHLTALLTGLLLSVQGSVAGIPANNQLAQVSQTASLSLSPSSNSVSVNSTFTVNIILNTGGQAAYGVDINRLRFNPSILQVVDADAATSGVQIQAGTIMPLTIINTVDNTGGSIQFSQLATPGSTFSGSGTLASITFRAIASGSSSLNFDFTLGNGTDTNVAGLGGDMLSSVAGGSYTGITLDITPPTISSISATNITTTGATIVWTTNEASDTQVEYGLTTSYGNQTSVNSSMITSHSVTLPGLSGGTLYNYRVRSRDAAGNLSVSGNNTFTTVTPPDTTPPSSPTNLTATVVSSTQINLSWTASTDNVGVVGYRIERCSGSATCSNFAQLATPATNSYSNTGLTPNTIYRYRVGAIDYVGNLSAYSSAVNATSQAIAKRPKKIRLQSLEGRSSIASYPQATVYVVDPVNSNVVDTQTLTADSLGDYTVNFSPTAPTSVNLRVLISGYLSRLVSGVDTTVDSAASILPQFKGGDFNTDRLVNSLDFSYMNTRWGNNDVLADLNKDGTINSLDFAFLSNNWLQAGE